MDVGSKDEERGAKNIVSVYNYSVSFGPDGES